MLVTEFSTEVVAAPERFVLFEENTAESHLRTRQRSNDREDFRAKVRVLDLGELQVSALSFPHLEIARTAKMIRQSDPEVYMISYMLGAEGLFPRPGATRRSMRATSWCWTAVIPSMLTAVLFRTAGRN